MTVICRALVLLVCMIETLLWVRTGGQNVVSPQGKTDQGSALGLFLNDTLPGNNFTQNAPCSWNESLVRCDDQHSNVTGLNLSGLQLIGTIREGSIANLTALEVLDLSNNNLNGSLPVDFHQLKMLTSLNLSRNSMTGTIPSYVQNLSALQSLDLSFNKMTGLMPQGFRNLGSLSVLRLNDNNFRGQLTEDSFPAKLMDLDLTTNSFNGPIPPSLFKLTALKFLKLGSNELSGDINTNDTVGLQLLDLHNNKLSGRIPNLNEPLSELYLHGNLLSGSLPSSVPANLTVFDVHHNRLEGNITAFVDSLKTPLSVLDLSSNQFSLQDFPDNFSHLVNLTRLGLADNTFIEHTFPVLPIGDLMFLDLSNTKLSGSIPDAVVNATKLVFLDLSQNELNGSIPKTMDNLKDLEVLDLSANHLSGPIPSHLSDLTFLRVFDVSHNNLSGPVPTGNQFATFENTSYLGNSFLCGSPLSLTCSDSGDANATSGESKTSTGPIIAGVFTGVIAVFIVGAALFIWCRVSRAVKPLGKDETKHVSGPMHSEKDAETWATGIKDPSAITVVMFEKPLLNLSFADLLQATANFSKEMQVADGGYGPVYKGVLADGTQLAIKVLVEVGFSDDKEAAARIEVLARVVKHPNLVALLGYCLVGEDRVLIYEYMVNCDLQRWLHELPESNSNPDDWSRDTWEHPDGEICGDYLSWPSRHKIALGAARALAFLHHGCSPHVIHRDVKSSNILLDESFDPHLVDSGLAGIARMNGTPIIGGTLGYIPPEYGQTWQATTRGDVYSFGVVLLELVTGRKPTGHYFHDSYGGNLVGWVRSMIKQDKRGQKALDPKLVSRGFVTDMLETLRIGYLCTSENPAKRPTMQQVVGLLKDCQPSVLS